MDKQTVIKVLAIFNTLQYEQRFLNPKEIYEEMRKYGFTEHYLISLADVIKFIKIHDEEHSMFTVRIPASGPKSYRLMP